MEEDNIDVQFESEHTTSKSAETFRDLVMRQYSKCQDLASKELHRGGTRMIFHEGKQFEVSTPDTINAFCHSARALHSTVRCKMVSYEKDWEKISKPIKEKEKELQKLCDNYLKTPQTISSNTSTLHQKANAYNEQHFKGEKDRIELEIAFLMMEGIGILLDTKLRWFSEGGKGN